MDSLDISHWPCDLVMQSPLIPTYDEWNGGGGGLKQRYEGSCSGGCPLCKQRFLIRRLAEGKTCIKMSECAFHYCNHTDAGGGH